MTSEEVCKALSLSKRALQYDRSAGIIPYTSMGNKIFFREEDIARILRDNLINVAK